MFVWSFTIVTITGISSASDRELTTSSDVGAFTTTPSAPCNSALVPNKTARIPWVRPPPTPAAIKQLDIPVKVVPGVTASIGAAAVLGAPIMHDFCHISLSDLMTPWEVIEKRLRLAAEADFVICLYNPRSKGRSEHLANAFKIMGEFKDGSTPVGIVKDVGREDQEKFICTFDTMDFERVDMTTMVIIGNKSTYIHDDLMITPRGYTV